MGCFIISCPSYWSRSFNLGTPETAVDPHHFLSQLALRGMVNIVGMSLKLDIPLRPQRAISGTEFPVSNQSSSACPTLVQLPPP
jgi:hypothetical protein